MAKYVQFALIVLVCIVADQWTKQVASSRLAASHSDFDHPLVLTVSPDDEGETVLEFIGGEFEKNTESEVKGIVARYVENPDGKRLVPNHVLKSGDVVHVTYRKVIVVPGYFEFEYTRNPGAAFGILSKADSPLRKPFFVLVSLIAVVVIAMMLRGVTRKQQLTIWALSLIAGGAIGNLIDRVAYGWVIDFIVWKYTDEWRWPTFNIADAFISVGVALLVLDMIVDAARSGKQMGPEITIDSTGDDAS